MPGQQMSFLNLKNNHNLVEFMIVHPYIIVKIFCQDFNSYYYLLCDHTFQRIGYARLPDRSWPGHLFTHIRFTVMPYCSITSRLPFKCQMTGKQMYIYTTRRHLEKSIFFGSLPQCKIAESKMYCYPSTMRELLKPTSSFKSELLIQQVTKLWRVKSCLEIYLPFDVIIIIFQLAWDIITNNPLLFCVGKGSLVFFMQ